MSSYVLLIVIVEILNKVLGVTSYLWNPQRLPVCQSRSKILSYSAILKNKYSRWGSSLRKPYSYITLQLARGLPHLFILICILWVLLFLSSTLVPGICCDLETESSTTHPSSLKLFSWKPCWNFSLYPSNESYFINPVCHSFCHLIMCYPNFS